MTLAVTAIMSFLIIFAAVMAMAIGVLAGRAPIKGSCGGVNGKSCELCSNACRNKTART